MKLKTLHKKLNNELNNNIQEITEDKNFIQIYIKLPLKDIAYICNSDLKKLIEQHYKVTLKFLCCTIFFNAISLSFEKLESDKNE